MLVLVLESVLDLKLPFVVNFPAHLLVYCSIKCISEFNECLLALLMAHYTIFFQNILDFKSWIIEKECVVAFDDSSFIVPRKTGFVLY